MSASVTSFAIRYKVEGRVEIVYPKTHLTKKQTQVAIGRIIDAAHEHHLTLLYVTVVPCVKRPGTKAIVEISRNTMSQDDLVKACNAYHRIAVSAK